MSHATPVVVLRSGHHGDLGIARSLGRLGVPVFSADAAWWEPICRSRYCRGRLRLHLEDSSAGRAVTGLLEAGRKLGDRPILIPTTDREAIWVADHAAALREVFRFPSQNAGLVRVLSDKSLMQHLARSSGVPTPQSAVPRSKDDVEQFVESAVFPVMVKATDVESMRRRAGGTKFLIHTPRQLLDLYMQAEDPDGPNLMIQEFIPGEDWMFDGYFGRDSECVFGVTGKKIRRFPVYTGVTSLGVCIRNETVERTTARFMKAIGYQGILDIGYRRDQRDGQYKVLDVNPRIGCTFRLFAGTNAMDVARVLYLDLTGQPVPQSSACVGRKWVVEDFDLFSSYRLWREGALTWKQWVRSFRGVQEKACFALDDPLPFLWMWAADGGELYRWIRRRAGAQKTAPLRTAEAGRSAGLCGEQ
jgi:D-aspartate ligase